MSSVMTSRQASELDHAFERNHWTAEMVKRLSEGNILAQVAAVVLGHAVIQMVRRTVTRVPFEPTMIGPGWSWWKGPATGNGLDGDEDCDQRSLALVEVDFTLVLWGHCLDEKGTLIKGEEKLRRLKGIGHILLDPAFGWALINEPGQKTLNWLYETSGATYLDFFGRILRDPHGDRGVLCLFRDDDGHWHWDVRWLGGDWGRGHLSSFLANQD